MKKVLSRICFHKAWQLRLPTLYKIKSESQAKNEQRPFSVFKQKLTNKDTVFLLREIYGPFLSR